MQSLETSLPTELTVTQLSQALKRTLESAFGYVRVRGEISGLKRHTSGHVYFSLKDDESVLNAVCWQATWKRQNIALEEGMSVICIGRITSYPPRSNYQIQVDQFELAGEGTLLKQLEELKKKLAREGLFSQERKKPLPYLPGVIGIITSPTGAVIRDILHRISDRFPRHIILWPVAVQGEGAAQQIVKAIEGFNTLEASQAIPRPDLLIVARGGGSLEDLWSFNLESVARAVAGSNIPLVSAVGHETDTTLIDYAADYRAPTPTAAAEVAVPVRSELWRYVDSLKDRKELALLRIIEEKSLRFDDWCERYGKTLPKILRAHQEKVMQVSARLRHPRDLLLHTQTQLQTLGDRLKNAVNRFLEQREVKLEKQILQLNSYSYHNTLKRGFTMVRDASGRPLTQAIQALRGMNIEVVFHDGVCQAEIIE